MKPSKELWAVVNKQGEILRTAVGLHSSKLMVYGSKDEAQLEMIREAMKTASAVFKLKKVYHNGKDK